MEIYVLLPLAHVSLLMHTCVSLGHHFPWHISTSLACHGLAQQEALNKIWAWASNYTTQFYVDVITCPCPGLIAVSYN